MLTHPIPTEGKSNAMSVLMKHNTPNSPARLLRAPRAVVGAITTSGHRGSGRVYGTHTPAHVV